MVVNAKVLGDGADADATIVHHGNRRRDRLVDGQRNGLEELSLNQDLGDGAKPLRTRPPPLTCFCSVTDGIRRPDSPEAGQEEAARNAVG